MMLLARPTSLDNIMSMPLVGIKKIGEGARLGVWRMSEELDELPRPDGISFADIRSETRLREKLTEYRLLEAMTGRCGGIIRHEPSGRPLVDGYEVSISHTRGWAVMVLSKGCRVGVDIEYCSTRVNRVANRFIRSDEQNDDLRQRLINWSVKETVYKLFSEEDLQYFDMRLRPFEAAVRGEVVVDDLKHEKSVTVRYVLTDEYVLSWAVFYAFFNKIKQK